MTWTSNRGQDGFDGLLLVVCDFRPRRFLLEKLPRDGPVLRGVHLRQPLIALTHECAPDPLLQNVRISPAGFTAVGNAEFVRIDLASTVVRLADCTRVQTASIDIAVFFNAIWRGMARSESLRLTSSCPKAKCLEGTMTDNLM